jgi:hypothetical protein
MIGTVVPDVPRVNILLPKYSVLLNADFYQCDSSQQTAARPILGCFVSQKPAIQKLNASVVDLVHH